MAQNIFQFLFGYLVAHIPNKICNRCREILNELYTLPKLDDCLMEPPIDCSHQGANVVDLGVFLHCFRIICIDKSNQINVGIYEVHQVVPLILAH